MKKPIITKILAKVAPLSGAKIIIEPEYGFTGQIIFKNGKRSFFHGRNFNINTAGSVAIARDKGYTKFFLKKFGYKTTKGKTFFSKNINKNIKLKRTIKDAVIYAKKLGFPVILKPNNKSQGMLVSKIYNTEKCKEIARKILQTCGVMLVEEFYPGNDYRIIVLDGKIISAYQRLPLTIEGNGKNTIKQLLLKKQAEFKKNGRDTIIDMKDDRISTKLKREKYTFSSILPKNHTLPLLDNTNLSTGGTSRDVKSRLHPSFRALAKKVAQDFALRLCGIDILTNDITKPIKNYAIIELNSAPGLDNYTENGKKQDKKVENLYLKVLEALRDGT